MNTTEYIRNKTKQNILEQIQNRTYLKEYKIEYIRNTKQNIKEIIQNRIDQNRYKTELFQKNIKQNILERI